MNVQVPRPIAVLLLVGMLIAAGCGTSSGGYHSRGFVRDGMTCEHGESPQQHEHIHLSLFAEGKPLPLAEYIGLDSECLLPLHTYDASGVVHIETATERSFTLGNFFSIWNKALTSSTLMDLKTDGAHQIRAFVNGEAFDGDPQTIPLTPHADIVVIYGPPFALPAPYQFAPSEP